MDEYTGRSNEDAVNTGSSLVTARGTGDGLILRLDGRSNASALLSELETFVESRRTFLTGNEVRLEWFGDMPDLAVEDRVRDELKGRYRIKVISSDVRREEVEADDIAEDTLQLKSLTSSLNTRDGSLSLFSGMAAYDESGSDNDEELMPAIETRGSGGLNEGSLWDEPDARIIYRTLRSGQRIETEHSLIIFGDVNSGAEVIAGGDIVVLGTLRGVAHAGAYDETGAGRVIVALSLEPTQLRIGSVISRGESESGKNAEIARVDGDIIVVERYQSRGSFSRTKR